MSSTDHDLSLPVLNIATYKFITLDDLGRRRRELREFCREQKLRGTVLLSTEGINVFVAGTGDSIEALVCRLQSDPAIGCLDVKRSRSAKVPFRRMLVKVKREIISMGVDDVAPARKTSPKVSATDLRNWLSEGRDITLLDVRNDYEVELGTFRGARPIGVNHFRDFPSAVGALPADWKKRAIVMFCTGGIRCEKAGPQMEQAGFEHVMQLDGGILKYFEECGGEHYDGDCFVFDQRVALDNQLKETETTQCFACQATLTPEDQKSPKYVIGEACPNCYRDSAELMKASIARRHARIRELTDPLPGSVPYENRRPLNVPARCDGMPLLEMLVTLHPHVGRDVWRRSCGAGEFEREGIRIHAETQVQAGERIEHVEPETIEPAVNADIRILHEDAMLVVVHKPAPLPMHACGRFHHNTLLWILDRVYAPQRLRVAHRLDANTSGVVVMTRTRNVASLVQPQFEAATVKKQYIARVCGVPSQVAFSCDAAISAKPGHSGARCADPDGLASHTDFELLCDLGETSLVLARPVTGRTNQIRLHLAHLGHPIVGDPMYLAQGVGDRQTLDVEDDPLCLHAWKIAFRHPADGSVVEFTAPLPSWADAIDADNKREFE